jgi:dipeptidyl aminopeptidase/acylaminoacyl peptidase
MRSPLTELRLSLAAAAVVAAALLSYACGGSGGQATPSPSPASGSPVSGTPTATPQPPVEPTSYRFLYSEFGADADIIWSIKPDDPADRVQVASVPHKTGWAITPALSPDGKKIAYTVMPDEALSSNTDADAYVLDIASGKPELVARRVDLLTSPRWSPDGGLLFLRQNAGEDVTIILVDLREPEENETPVAAEDQPPPVRTVLRRHVSDVLAYIPLGFDAKIAMMYFVQIQGGTEGGSYLGRYGPATGGAVATATAIADVTATAVAGTPPVVTPAPSPSPVLSGDVFLVLSDQIARDYALSPDAARVAFLVPGLVQGQFVSRTDIADITSEDVSALPSPAGLSPGDQLSPAWHPDGESIAVGQLPSGNEPGRVAVVPLDGGKPLFLPQPDKGFDQPLSWSPDGKFLAVTSFSGGSLANPGSARLVFISVNGQRPAAPEGAEIRPVGWLAAE